MYIHITTLITCARNVFSQMLQQPSADVFVTFTLHQELLCLLACVGSVKLVGVYHYV